MCLTGASWLQQEVLSRNPDSKLAVYAVWEKGLPTDSRAEWDGSVLADRRVDHFWDPDRVVREALAAQGDAQESRAHLDQFFVFGPEANWAGSPSGLLETGRSILGRSDEVRKALTPLLGP